MTDNTFSMTMRSFWATVAIIPVAILGIGLAIGMMTGRRAPRPCAQAAWAPEFVQGEWVCLAFPDKYICNVHGKAEVYNKNGEYIAPKEVLVPAERLK